MDGLDDVENIIDNLKTTPMKMVRLWMGGKPSFKMQNCPTFDM